MFLRLVCSVLFAVVAAPENFAQSALLDFAATLDGTALVPPNATQGSGYGRLVLDPAVQILRIELEAQGLASILGAELRAEVPGTNGSMVAQLQTSGATGFSGLIAVDSTLNDHLSGGDLYLQVGTAAYPAGELRGAVNALAFGLEHRPLGIVRIS